MVETRIDSVEWEGKSFARQDSVDCPACGKVKLSLDLEQSEDWGTKFEEMRRAEALPNERHELNEKAKAGTVMYDDFLVQRRRIENSYGSSQIIRVSREVGFKDVKCPKCKTLVRFNFQLISQVPQSNAPTFEDLRKLQVHEEFHPEIRRLLRLPSTADLSQFAMCGDLATLSGEIAKATEAIHAIRSVQQLGRTPDEETLKRDILLKASELKNLASNLDSIITARKSAYARAVEAAVMG